MESFRFQASNSRSQISHSRSAFTLVELLVVIGIIALLIGILLPMINRAYTRAEITRLQMDMATIATALGQYKTDHGMYPPTAGPGTGAAVLAKALCGMGDATFTAAPYAAGAYKYGDFAESSGNNYLCIWGGTAATTPTPPSTDHWVLFSPADGLDGPGWRVRPGAKPVPAYLNPADFRADMAGLKDHFGKYILYLPQVRTTNIAMPNGYASAPSATASPMYDLLPISSFFSSTAQIQDLLGDRSHDGTIGPGETAATTGPYTLWSAGLDGDYGTTDDILYFP